MTIKITFLLMLFISINYAAPSKFMVIGQDTAAVDSIKKPVPDYKSVNVIVETDWGTTDKTENVDVYIKKQKGKHTDLILKKSEHQECIIELVSGMVVKIVDRKTGKILKTYKP